MDQNKLSFMALVQTPQLKNTMEDFQITEVVKEKQ